VAASETIFTNSCSSVVWHTSNVSKLG